MSKSFIYACFGILAMAVTTGTVGGCAVYQPTARSSGGVPRNRVLQFDITSEPAGAIVESRTRIWIKKGSQVVWEGATSWQYEGKTPHNEIEEITDPAILKAAFDGTLEGTVETRISKTGYHEQVRSVPFRSVILQGGWRLHIDLVRK